MAYEFSELDLQFLSSMMFNPKGLMLLDREVGVGDFTDPLYYDLYQTMVGYLVDNKSLDYSVLKFQFKNDELSYQLLIKLESIPPVSDLQLVHNALCEKTRLIKLKKLGTDVYNQAQQKGVDSKTLMAKIEEELLQVNMNSSMKMHGISDVGTKFVKQFQDRIERFRETNSIQGVVDITTGFDRLDSYTLGFHRGNIWIIGGGTSDGKTQLAVQMLNSITKSGHRALYFLLEDTGDKLMYRLVACRNKINLKKLLSGGCTDKERDTVMSDFSRLAQANRIFVEDTMVDINDIVMLTQFAKLRFPDLACVFVDHINLITDRSLKANANREQEIGGASKKLVALAKRCDINIVVLQQLNTNPDERKKGMPITVNDLRDCKSTSHDSSVTLLINCPDKYDDAAKFSRVHTQLILAKNRYGETNKIIEFTNRANIGRFEEGLPATKGK